MDASFLQRCEFSTDRLIVGEWHALAERYDVALTGVVSAVLTSATTNALPEGWRGDYDTDRARQWISERDAESPTLLVIGEAFDEAIGLVMLHATPNGELAVDIRIGYVLAEAVWGRGIATELVGGLVAWGRSQARVASLVGGVAVNNVASIRVLTRNGFTLSERSQGEEIYTIVVD